MMASADQLTARVKAHAAANLAGGGSIADYPLARSWFTRPVSERVALPARYSLIMSLRTAQQDIDV